MDLLGDFSIGDGADTTGSTYYDPGMPSVDSIPAGGYDIGTLGSYADNGLANYDPSYYGTPNSEGALANYHDASQPSGASGGAGGYSTKGLGFANSQQQQGQGSTPAAPERQSAFAKAIGLKPTADGSATNWTDPKTILQMTKALGVGGQLLGAIMGRGHQNVQSAQSLLGQLQSNPRNQWNPTQQQTADQFFNQRFVPAWQRPAPPAPVNVVSNYATGGSVDDDDPMSKPQSLGQFHKSLGDQIRSRVEYTKMLTRNHTDWDHNVGDQLLSRKTGKLYNITGRSIQNIGSTKNPNMGAVYHYEHQGTDEDGSPTSERGTFHQSLMRQNPGSLVNLTTPQNMAEGGEAMGGDAMGPMDDQGPLGQAAQQPQQPPEGLVNTDGTGQSDDVPVNLSGGEYIIPADVVALIGDGNNAAGAKILDQWVQQVRQRGRSTGPEDNPPPHDGQMPDGGGPLSAAASDDQGEQP